MRERCRARARLRENEKGLTGLPLYIFILVVIAGVCLVVILGFLVVSKPDLDTIQVDPMVMDGWSQDIIYCNWTEDTNSSAFSPSTGEHWYAGAKLDPSHEPDPYMFDKDITIICTDNDGEPMSEVRVVISGAGVNDAGTTKSTGKVVLSLRGCHLGPNDRQGEIKVEAKYDSTFGTQKKTTSITVLAGDTTPDLGTKA